MCQLHSAPCAGDSSAWCRRLERMGAAEDQIIAILTPIFGRYASEREKGEHFGDFVVRKGYVEPMVGPWGMFEGGGTGAPPAGSAGCRVRAPDSGASSGALP